MYPYRRRDKDIFVLAVQLVKANVKEVAEWCSGQEVREIDALNASITFVGINLETWDGRKRASEGDYILQDDLGHFHIRHISAFESGFEPVV